MSEGRDPVFEGNSVRVFTDEACKEPLITKLNKIGNAGLVESNEKFHFSHTRFDKQPHYEEDNSFEVQYEEEQLKVFMQEYALVAPYDDEILCLCGMSKTKFVELFGKGNEIITNIFNEEENPGSLAWDLGSFIPTWRDLKSQELRNLYIRDLEFDRKAICYNEGDENCYWLTKISKNDIQGEGYLGIQGLMDYLKK